MIEDILEVEDTGLSAPIFFGPKQSHELECKSGVSPEVRLFRLSTSFFVEFKSTNEDLELKIRNAKLQMKRKVYDDVIDELHNILADSGDFDTKILDLIQSMTVLKE